MFNKSLVIEEPDADGSVRSREQEVLRQFGQERLRQRAPVEIDAVHERHAAYYLALVEHAESRGLGGDRRLWLDRLERELDNFRAARRWFVAHEDGERAQ